MKQQLDTELKMRNRVKNCHKYFKNQRKKISQYHNQKNLLKENSKAQISLRNLFIPTIRPI